MCYPLVIENIYIYIYKQIITERLTSTRVFWYLKLFAVNDTGPVYVGLLVYKIRLFYVLVRIIVYLYMPALYKSDRPFYEIWNAFSKSLGASSMKLNGTWNIRWNINCPMAKFITSSWPTISTYSIKIDIASHYNFSCILSTQ